MKAKLNLPAIALLVVGIVDGFRNFLLVADRRTEQVWRWLWFGGASRI